MANRIAKGQIVFLSSLTIMAFVILCFFAVQQLRKSNKMRMIDEVVEHQHGLSLEIFRTDVDFFGYELNNNEFYKTGKSIYLEQHDSLLIEIRKLFNETADDELKGDSVGMLLNSYDSVFDQIVEKIKQRGYRDYGLEGTMRSHAHALENRHLIPQVDLLTLRRYEKDYLLRSDNIYVDKFDSLMQRLKSGSPASPANQLLLSYASAFHELVKTSDLIGLETQTNLKEKLDKLTKQLILEIEERDGTADLETFKAYQQGLTLFSIGIVVCTILCLTLIIVIAKEL